MCDGIKHGSPLSTTYSLQANRASTVPLVRMACPRGWLCKGAVAQPPHLGILGGGVTWVWDTRLGHVRGWGHSTLMEYAMVYSVAPKNPQKRGRNESWGWVCKGCASGQYHTSSQGLHTSAAIYMGKTVSKGQNSVTQPQKTRNVGLTQTQLKSSHHTTSTTTAFKNHLSNSIAVLNDSPTPHTRPLH